MVRTILIENTTLVAKTWINQLLDAAETFDIQESVMSKWANDPTVITDIASGELKVIKSIGPTVYYTAIEGQRILDGLAVGIAAAGGSGELLCSGPTGDLVWTSAVGGSVSFYSDGATNNKWLKVGDGQVQTSDKSPIVFPYDSIIYALSFTNKTNSADMDFEIYKNATLLFTWSVVDKRYGYKTNGLETILFNAGDRMSVLCVSTGTIPNNPLLNMSFSYQNGIQSEGGSSTL